MIDIYAMHFIQNGSIQENKTLIQSVPAANEGEIYLVDPKVSMKTGEAESLDFTVQPGSPYFDAFFQMRSFLYVEYDGDLIFYGRVLTIENGFYGEQKIKCEGAQAFFNDSYFPGIPEGQREERTVGEYIAAVLDNHNTQLEDSHRSIYPGEIPGQYSGSVSAEQQVENAYRAFGENGWKQTKPILDDLATHYGGMFRVRHGSDDRLYLDWLKHYYRSSVNQQTIEVGKNMIEASNITEVNNIFTVVLPVGEKSASEKMYIDGMYFPVSRVTEFYTEQELDSGYHHMSDYTTAIARYGRIIKPQEFDDAKTEEELLAECAKWVKENFQGGVEEFTVAAVDLHQIGENIQKIMCGDRVRIRYPIGDGQIDERTLTCTSASYSLYDPQENQYSFGIPASSLSRGYSVNSSKTKQDAESKDPPSYGGGSGIEPTPYEKWWKQAKDWLYNHRVWCKSWPLDPATEKRGRGPSDDDYFIRLTGTKIDGEQAWRVFKPAYTTRQIEITGQTVSQRVFRTVFEWTRDTQGRPLAGSGRWSIVKESELNRDLLVKNKLFEYILEEWDYSLANGGKHKMPAEDDMGLSAYVETDFVDELSNSLINMDPIKIVEPIMDQFGHPIGKITEFLGDSLGINVDGLTATIGNITNGLGQKVKGVLDFAGDKLGITSFLEDTGEKIKGTFVDILNGSFNADGSIISQDVVEGLRGLLTSGDVVADGDGDFGGDVTFTDASGNTQSLRDIKIELVQTDNKVGSIATKYFEDPLHPGDPNYYKPVAYEFTQSIENYLGGGDIVVARVEGDEVLIGNNKASEVVTQALHHITDVVGDVEYATDSQGRKYWKVHSGAGFQIERNSATFGVYDEGNLTGGVMVEKLNDNTVTTHIKGNRIIVGTLDDQTAQTMQDKFGDVDGLIAARATIADLNAVKARVSTLETDYLRTSALSSAISLLDKVNIQNTLQINSSAKILFVGSGTGESYSLTTSVLKNMIKSASVSNNTLTLTPFYGNPITFSKAVSLSGAWNSGTYLVSATSGTISGQAPSTLLYDLGLGTPTKGSGNTVEATYDIGYGVIVSGQWRRGGSTGKTGTISLDATNLLENKGTVTSNGTYTPSTGKLGISSIRVNVSDIGNAKSRFNAASGAYYIESYDNRSGNSIANSSVTYQLATTGSGTSTSVQVQNTSGTKISNTPELPIGSVYSGGYTDGHTAGVADGKAAEKNLVRVRFNANNGMYYAEAYENVSGAPAISNASVTYKLGTSGSGSSTSVQVQDSSGTQISNTPSLSVGSLYTGGQNSVSVIKGSWNNSTVQFNKSAGTASTSGVTIGTSGTWSSGNFTAVLKDYYDNAAGVEIGYTVSTDIGNPSTSNLSPKPSTESISGRKRVGTSDIRKSNIPAPGYIFFTVTVRGKPINYYIGISA